MNNTPRWYGVSTGNGNDGVSQMYPDYYVFTSEPWELAELALKAHFNGQEWAMRHAEIDGDAEYTIYATIDAPPCEDTEDGEYPDSDDWENEEDGRNWSDGNGAWFILEVFPVDSDTARKDGGALAYEHPLCAFGYEAFAL